MTQAIDTHRKLSNVQVVLLQAFQFDLPDAELLEVKEVLSKHFAHKARMEADRLIDEGKITLKGLEKASKQITEHRGNYLKKIRNEGGN